MATELRWILLGLGALFVAGLAVWEWRRPRHAARKSSSGEEMDAQGWLDTPVMRASDEAAIEIPEIRASDRRRDPPIVLLEEMRADDGEDSVQVAVEVAIDRPYAADPAPEPDAPLPLSMEPVETPPIQWPPARQDRILWLRVVPLKQGDRFSGRALRQALTGCGLVHGPQDIFHWVDDTGAVIASAANLLRPGNFDPQTMDYSEYPGLHLFAVLPGPLVPLQAYDELLRLARDLAARLHGEVQDERGEPVDAASIEAQRDSLRPGGEAAEAEEGARE